MFHDRSKNLRKSGLVPVAARQRHRFRPSLMAWSNVNCWIVAGGDSAVFSGIAITERLTEDQRTCGVSARSTCGVARWSPLAVRNRRAGRSSP